jgi:hypothetical protein
MTTCVVGEYVVTKVFVAPFANDRPHYGWRVYMRKAWGVAGAPPVFATTRKREALKHARMLERERLKIYAIIRGEFSTPDARLRAIAENHKRVMRLWRDEQDA